MFNEGNEGNEEQECNIDGCLIEIEGELPVLFTVIRKFFPDHPQDEETWQSYVLAEAWTYEGSDRYCYHITKEDGLGGKGIEIFDCGQAVSLLRNGNDFHLGIYLRAHGPTFDKRFQAITLFLVKFGAKFSFRQMRKYPTPGKY